MYIQFKTISIGPLVISYFAIMGICLLLYLGFKIIIPAVLFLFLPVLLYFLFRGEVELKTTGDKFLVTWIKKPLFHSQKDSAINLNEVIRWKHERSFRGPESFTIILKNGKQLKFRPAMFSLRDWQSELWKEFDITMRKFQSNTSKEELYNRIAYSGYMAKLNKRIKIITYSNYYLITSGLLSLILIIPFRSYETTLSIVFFTVFILLVGFTIYKGQLKYERAETLKR